MAAITITDARKAFARWVETVGGMTTKEAREKNLPITGTFHLEEWRIGDGKVTVRVSQIFNENGATSDPLGYTRMTCRDFCGAVSVAISTLEIARKLQSARLLAAIAVE